MVSGQQAINKPELSLSIKCLLVLRSLFNNNVTRLFNSTDLHQKVVYTIFLGNFRARTAHHQTLYIPFFLHSLITNNKKKIEFQHSMHTEVLKKNKKEEIKRFIPPNPPHHP
jgi:hypothetical protein